MERAARTERLANLVAQARRIQVLAQPATAWVLRVLDALSAEDIQELSLWQLHKERAEGIVDRLTVAMGEPRQVVRNVLGKCLQLDLWGNYDQRYLELRECYARSGEPDAAIERTLGRPPLIYSFLIHGCVGQWQPKEGDYSSLIIEDDHWGAICDGFLVAKGRAFSTNLALLEASVREEWLGWQALWKWF